MNDDMKQAFQAEVWEYYQAHGRHQLPWRLLPADGSAAYEIVVSELMLQQTQVSRVIPKYEQFLELFPSVQALAKAPLGEVLRAWSGLGYNRRAKFLHEAARQVTRDYKGKFPLTISALSELPGIGANTAGAIAVYASNQPIVFIETNIRTVFIHHFFDDEITISDKAILALVAETLDHEHPREWYWALMDYGAYLKQTIGNLSRRSKSYVKQSKFEGSRRQVRGQIVRLLGDRPASLAELRRAIPDSRLAAVLEELVAEKLIKRYSSGYRL